MWFYHTIFKYSFLTIYYIWPSSVSSFSGVTWDIRFYSIWTYKRDKFIKNSNNKKKNSSPFNIFHLPMNNNFIKMNHQQMIIKWILEVKLMAMSFIMVRNWYTLVKVKLSKTKKKINLMRIWVWWNYKYKRIRQTEHHAKLAGKEINYF